MESLTIVLKEKNGLGKVGGRQKKAIFSSLPSAPRQRRQRWREGDTGKQESTFFISSHFGPLTKQRQSHLPPSHHTSSIRKRSKEGWADTN
mmetsp:Transcript_52805/g.103249  ORF Transcript_52805/g.103249 Transcript_52805/m.103249 type:complete len:91 (+) Transcript_52805:178-450(+)